MARTLDRTITVTWNPSMKEKHLREAIGCGP